MEGFNVFVLDFGGNSIEMKCSDHCCGSLAFSTRNATQSKPLLEPVKPKDPIGE